ncbi:MAG TPA: trehalose-6-phosphate synthase [Anaerolineae bacterium]|nr:trehalose-6-phosphate synthase [Anaerolineae bacterium]
MSDLTTNPPSIRSRRARLRRLVRGLFAERSLIIASNRGPVTYEESRSGRVRSIRGTGGMVSAVSAISRYANPIWICSPMTPADREMAKQHPGDLIPYSTKDYNFRVRFVLTEQESYDQFYFTVSNPLLWFLQHYMWDLVRVPTFTDDVWAAWRGYQQINQAFAEAIAAQAASGGRCSIIVLQDYHLYLCPGALAPLVSEDCLLSHFIHIPWPGPDYWMVLPPAIREQILASLCCNDVLGFHTRRYALSFLRTCESLLPDAKVDYSALTVRRAGKTLFVRSYPISVDVRSLRRVAKSRRTSRERSHLLDRLGDQTIVRVDRIDPSKNIVRGFQALDLLFERHPRHLGHVRLLGLLVPSRLGIEEYQKYLDEVIVAAQRLNLKYGDRRWQPVDLIVGEDRSRAIAAMQLYDVLLVNPIIDGMNLVAKEGPIVNERDGVLVMSESAGASEELGEGALIVSPYDVVQTADALHRALVMSPEERTERAAKLRDSVEQHTVSDWLYDQLVDLSRLLPG